MRRSHRLGFTLIELSIVLVIIGLIAGGVLVGRDLIRQSKLRAVITEHQQYVTAVQTFRLKYNALPGDMPNATTFWGQHTNPNCQLNPSTTGTATCDGDGDKMLEWYSGDYARGNEPFRFWHHLSNAGLVNFSTYGVGGTVAAPTNTERVCVGGNVPRSKVEVAGWHATHDPATLTPVSGNVLLFGAQWGACTVSGRNYEPAITPREAFSLEQKIDDTVPTTGKVIAYEWGSCYTGSAYDANNTIACGLFFTRDF